MAWLTQRVPTLCIEHIPTIMKELVVGIPPIWICLMRQVARVALVYIDVVEAAAVEEDKESHEWGDQDDQGDQGGQAQTQEHFVDFDPFFVYYTVMTRSEDQKLDLSIWTNIHTHTHTHTYKYCRFYLHVFCNVFVVYFYAKCVKCQSKI